MGMSKQRKLFVGILGLALAGLVIDRTVLDGSVLGPNAAAAHSGARPDTDAAPTPAEDHLQEPLSSRGMLASRLRQVGADLDLDPGSVRDAFSPSELFTGPPPVEEQPDEPDFDKLAQAFAAAHRLTSVLVTSTDRSAVINGKRFVIGAQVDGFTLIEIQSRAAVFERDGRTVQLNITGQ
jgi:hypothetical protein